MYLTAGSGDGALALLEAGGIETSPPLRGGQLLVPSFDEVFGDLAPADPASADPATAVPVPADLATPTWPPRTWPPRTWPGS